MKKILILIIAILFISIFLITEYRPTNFKLIGNDNIKYAILVDGQKADQFPERGLYTVDVECENATGRWLYDEWKLTIDNFENNNIACNINFITTNKIYLNNYLESLIGVSQGNGMVIDEGTTDLPNYNVSTPLLQSQYENPILYYSDWASDSNGTSTSGTYVFNNNEWKTVPSAMSDDISYHFKFTVQDAGYYQICYTINPGYKYNRLYVYVNSENQRLGLGSAGYVTASETSVKSACQSLQYIYAGDSIKVVQDASVSYNGSLGISEITFSIKKYNTIKSELGIRYEGTNPNNYIFFNNELWRIIGVFDETTHGITGEKLVKIIRQTPLGGLAWNKTYLSYWSSSSLNQLLNSNYYLATDGTTSGNCYGYGDQTIQSNCDYTTRGIQEYYRPMIKNVTWHIGSLSSDSIGNESIEKIFSYERGDIVYDGVTTTTGYIGLMHPSDYAYAVLGSDCSRETTLGRYNTNACAGKNWLYNNGNEWVINSSLYGSQNVLYLSSSGNLTWNSNAEYGYAVSPVLYLDSSVYVLDGTGMQSDPYIIGM